jgi:ribonuclease VapC
LRREDVHEEIRACLDEAAAVSIGAPTLFEVRMVAVARWGREGEGLARGFFDDREVGVIPFDERHAALALSAFTRYGKGRHPAALDYGDCMTYATARLAEMPLLFTGGDFARTDLASALPV